MMSRTGDQDFIQLDRTFHELGFDANAEFDAHMVRLIGLRNTLHWPDLLAEPRIILLSEAGSGKTAEIRNVARRLRDGGMSAFFIRIEHITRDFENSFEEGTYEEFSAWMASGQEGWLLLDSVDEARLREPGDFELAIKQLGRRIAQANPLVHIVITSRMTAWRSHTDLTLCRAAFPFQPIENIIADDPIESDQHRIARTKTSKDASTEPFKIIALDDIEGEKFDAFVRAKGVQDVPAFQDAVERKDAWPLTTRPQDLSELVEYWHAHGQIGSRLDLYESSISRRLVEHDQKRREAQPISKDRLNLGAQLLAAATTLGKQQAIRIPDGTHNAIGIPVEDVLTDWDDKERAALLNRPLFDEGIYGAVRFHHREVRELLTAKWLHFLLSNHASRAEIEGLIFKSQYGMEVITPTLRPILPWLILFDDRILERAIRISPEVAFEGGDPSQLPLLTRSMILHQVCEQIAQPAHGRSMTDYSAVQRFASGDLADSIRALLERYGGNEEVAAFLSRMIWHGQITALAPEMKELALDAENENYPRMQAIRALCEVGSEADREAVRHSLIAQEAPIPREWIAELAPSLPLNEAAVDWLLQALGHSEKKGRYEVDSLADLLSKTVAQWPPALLPRWISGLRHLLSAPPLIERRYCEISQAYVWLAPVAAEAILRLATERNSVALDEPALAILGSIPALDEYNKAAMAATISALQETVQAWPELNHALFWHEVAVARVASERNNGNRITDFWPVSIFRGFWNFDASSFKEICKDIDSKELEDDRLVALSLSFHLYATNGRPSSWRKNLKDITAKNEALNLALTQLLHPVKSEDTKKWRRQEARWKKRREQHDAKQRASALKWKEYIVENLHSALSPKTPSPPTNAQHYLFQAVREVRESSGKWACGNWQSLVPEFGETVAQAYRNGAIRFWRHCCPQLISEGQAENSTPFSTIFGLEGLEIESREVPNWTEQLSDLHARTAVRLALQELNGFPGWLPDLYAAYPQAVIELVMQEVDFELTHGDPEKDWHYVLSDVSWSGEWLWNGIAHLMVQRLRNPPQNLSSLRSLLTIVQGCSIPHYELSSLFGEIARTAIDEEAIPLWFAVWTGVEPEVAIPTLVSRLEEIDADEGKTQFMMRFITSLLGTRRNGSNVRQAFRTVSYMKTLLLLVHRYVRTEDDIHRAGQGGYSPGLRDNAQEARDTLLSFIRETRGKEAYLAILEIAKFHPNEASRPWLALHARQMATRDADIEPWLPGRVREFHEYAERTPSTHKELWEIAVSRLHDLKHDLEDGDNSIASMLIRTTEETEFRNYIGGWCRDKSAGRYSVVQEDELADAKRPDLRFNGNGFDAPVPVELKIADKWTGPKLHERLEEQLCGDYLRDVRSGRGIYLLVYRGEQSSWLLPNGSRAASFDALVESLQAHWTSFSPRYADVEEIKVIGINLTKRCFVTKPPVEKHQEFVPADK